MKPKKQILILLRETENEIEKQLNNDLKKLDLTMSQAAVLAALLECPEKQMTMKELERSIQLSQSVTAGIVLRMEQKGYLESFGDPQDKRIKIVKISEQGKNMCDSARKILSDFEKQLLSGFTKDEIDTFLNLTEKAFNNIA